MDQAIHRVVLSQLAAADSTANKLNVSNDDPATWQRLIKADADLECESFNATVVRWLCDWNFPGAAYPQVWRRTEPGADLAQRSEIEERIYKVGYRPTLAQIQNEYDGEWEPVPAPVPALPATPNAEPAPLAFAAPNDTAAATVAPLVERLGREAAPLIDQLLESARGLLKRSADFDEFRDGLFKLYPDLDSTAFAELLGQAFAVADAAGRFAVMDSTKEGDES